MPPKTILIQPASGSSLMGNGEHTGMSTPAHTIARVADLSCLRTSAGRTTQDTPVVSRILLI